jgi:hypothetical protein
MKLTTHHHLVLRLYLHVCMAWHELIQHRDNFTFIHYLRTRRQSFICNGMGANEGEKEGMTGGGVSQRFQDILELLPAVIPSRLFSEEQCLLECENTGVSEEMLPPSSRLTSKSYK